MVKRIKSSALLGGATSNNCFTVSEGVVTPPDTSKSLPIAYCFLQPTPGTYLMRLKKAVTKKKLL